MAADEEGDKEYRWETGYEKTWETIKEKDGGDLDLSVADIIQKAKRKAQIEKKVQNRLEILRHTYVVLDASEAMTDRDLKPTRQLCVLKLVTEFIEEFLYENPLCQLAFIMTRNKRAEKISDLGGGARKHTEAVKAAFGGPNVCQGELSLQNSLELALSTLKNMPSHTSREIIVVMASLTTCDPGDIQSTIKRLKSSGVMVSVINLAAEVKVCSVLASETGGTYAVALNDVHLRFLLASRVAPPPCSTARTDATALVKMGFPNQSAPATQGTGGNALAMCVCHVEREEGGNVGGDGYWCPQCRAKYCELPVECRLCGLMLASAPHLARSYHHLFPVDMFTELQASDAAATSCYTCLVAFAATDKPVYRCEICWRFFCQECDAFIHDTLHTCPGCATSRDTYQKKMDTD